MLRTAPKITSSMYESPQYTLMGSGTTDRVFLLGHADGLERFTPYRVNDMNEILNLIGDDTSPLARGLLEAYYAGARDIWVTAIDSMDNYEPELGNRNATYYQAHLQAVEQAFEILLGYDMAQITVLLDAPFNSTVDFLTPLVNHSAKLYEQSGVIHLGILGSRGAISVDLVDTLVGDARLADYYDEWGKYVAVFLGDVIFNFPEVGRTHTSSVAACVAGQVASGSLDRGITGKAVTNGISSVGEDLRPEDINRLAEAGLNAIRRSTRGRRGASYQVIYQTDNTLAEQDSVYWSLATMRLVSRVSATIRGMGVRRLGSIGMTMFKDEVNTYLATLTSANLLRGYSVVIDRDPSDTNGVIVDLALTPYFGIREIEVPIRVGPYQGSGS